MLKDLKEKGMRPSVNTDLNVIIEEGEDAGERWRHGILDGWELLGKKGKRRIGLCPNPNGDAFMGFADKNGEARMTFVVEGDGRPVMELRDKNGATRLTQPAALCYLSRFIL